MLFANPLPDFIPAFISLGRLIDAARMSERVGLPVCALTDGTFRTWASRPPLECPGCNRALRVVAIVV
ncbi:MAG: hypothetical protein JSS49_18865 [Planctomycetes bacterium]|nr:hypothetical protein [Planctomycetota bacterium]